MTTESIKQKIGFKGSEKRLHFRNKNSLKELKMFQNNLKFQLDKKIKYEIYFNFLQSVNVL